MGFLDRLRGIPDETTAPVMDRPVGGGLSETAASAEPVVDVSTASDEGIDQLITAGQMVAAVTLYREKHRTGIKVSVKAVEVRRDQLARGEGSLR